MKALQIKQYGGKDVLELNPNATKPVAGKGQVLVEAHAASINPIDWKVRGGYMKACTLGATIRNATGFRQEFRKLTSTTLSRSPALLWRKTGATS